MKKPDRLITILFALWLACFVLSFSMPFLVEAKGDGFTRGLNRISALIGWQFAAILLAMVGFIASYGRVRGNAALAWMGRGPFFLQMTLIVVVITLFLFQGVFNKPPSEPNAPKTATVPEASANPAPQVLTAVPGPATVEAFSGIYRSGFEASHFYATDGRGPWWMDADGELGERLSSYFVEGPGRSGGVTVALQLTGSLSDDIEDLKHLGTFEGRLEVVSIESIRPLTQKEFDQVQAAFLSQKAPPR